MYIKSVLGAESESNFAQNLDEDVDYDYGEAFRFNKKLKR